MTKIKSRSYLALLHGVGGGVFQVKSTEDYNKRIKALHEKYSTHSTPKITRHTTHVKEMTEKTKPTGR